MANKEDKETLQVDESKVGVQKDPPQEATQPAPPITPVTVEDTIQPAPPVSPTQEAAPQPSQDVSPSRPPADPVPVADPPRTQEAAQQPSQTPGTPAPPFEPQPVDVQMSKPPAGPIDVGFVPQPPAVLPDMPPPQLSVPAVLPQPPEFVPAPNATLPQPPEFVPEKPAELPQPPEFSPQPTVPVELKNVPVIPSQPAKLPDPPGFSPLPNAVLPDPPTVVPSVPAELPPPPDFAPLPNAMLPPMPAPPPAPNAVLPPMPAPPPAPNAVLPPPPDFVPNPNAVLPGPPAFNPNPNSVLPPMPAPPPSSPAVLPGPPAFASQPNAILPAPPAFVPQPNAILPQPPNLVNPQPYAPNGVLEPSKDILGRLDKVDADVKLVIQSLVPFSETGGGPPGSHANDPVVLAKNLRSLAMQVGPFGLKGFSSLQFVLFAMNVNGKIWNPNTLFPRPGSNEWVPAAVDDFVPHEALVLAHATIGSGLAAVEQNAIPLLNDTANPYSADNPYDQGNAGNFFSIGGMVDSITGKGFDPNSQRILVPSDVKAPVAPGTITPAGQIQKVSLASMYTPDTRLIPLGPGQPSVQIPLNTREATFQSLPGSGPKLAKAYYSSGIVPAGFDGEAQDPVGAGLGFITNTIRTDDPSTSIDDDDAYVPLSFMDMRPLGGTDLVRTVYFRPFITNLTEELAPEWNKQNFFGRTDAVATYMATGRTINLGFTVHAFAPEDLETIYQKKNWLASMCYPSYDKDMLFKAGPVIRLRVGDLLKTHGGFGLPGIIESLSFDFNETVWELQKGNKVPMGFKVSMTFLVLHEKPIGIGVHGHFGGIGKIDPGTGKWSPPQNTSNSDTQNAPEIEADGVQDFAGGTGNTINKYGK
jgi:hypothetical protein